MYFKKNYLFFAELGCKPKPEVIIYINPGFSAKCCPHCGKGEMHVLMCFGANAPPSQDMLNALKNRKIKHNTSLTP